LQRIFEKIPGLPILPILYRPQPGRLKKRRWSPAGLLFWFDKNQAQIADPGIGNSLNTTTMIGLPVPGKVMSAAVDLGDAAHQARGKQSAQARKQAV